MSASPDTNFAIHEIDIATDKYTGIVNVRIPIYSFGSDQSPIPITLSYHASGIRADDVASIVGLGWRLSAGGKITRSIRGRYDNHAQLTTTNDHSSWYGANVSKWMEQEWDTQPDQFYFELPGLSGSFVLDTLGVGYPIPYQNIKIEYKNPKFTIFDEQGTCYSFTTYDITTEQYASNRPPLTPSYISPWHLNSIEYLNGDKVDFIYDVSNSPNRTSHISYIRGIQYNNDSSKKGYSNEAKYIKNELDSMNISVLNTHLLKSILYKDQQIDFVYADEDSDVSSQKRLTDIIVKHRQSSKTVQVRKYQFLYDRFRYNRLKLTGITEVAEDQTSRPLCSFEYYTLDKEEDIPQRNNLGIDHWGYFRTKLANTQKNMNLICPQVTLKSDIDPAFPQQGITIPGVTDRSPNLEYTRVQSLKQINYPNGGSAEFIYELHHGYSEIEKRNIDAGGLRIHKIIKRSSTTDVPMTYEYKYEGGVVYDDERNYVLSEKKIVDMNGYGLQFYISNKIQSSPIDYYGASVVYSTVKEYFPNGSYIRYDYLPYDACPDNKPIHYSIDRFSYKYMGVAKNVISPKTSRSWMRSPLRTKTTYDSMGHMVDSTTYMYAQGHTRSLTGCTLQDALIDRVDPQNNTYRIGRYSVLSQAVHLCNETVHRGKYKLPAKTIYTYDSETELLSSKKRIDSDGVTTETTYTYAQNFEAADTTTLLGRLQQRNVLIPLEEITTRGGKVIAAKGRSFRLNEANRKAIVLDCEKSLTKAEPIDWTSFTSVQCTPSKIIFNNHYKNDISYLEYNASGQVLCYQDENGVNHSFLYTSNTTRPFMTLHNARLSATSANNEVFFTDFEHLTGPTYSQARSGTKALSTTPSSVYTISQKLKAGEYTAVFWHDKNGPSQPMKRRTAPVTVASSSTFPSVVFGIAGYVDDLCIIPRNATLSTCHYVPGWGNTLETDEQGRDLKTEYNGFGLPVKITNHNGIVVKQYEYK